ncbi:MAG: GerMN domain-containing protein [Clostridiales bacterium]|nr:GerMN domain-containing protein [Clostridiales bacterium]
MNIYNIEHRNHRHIFLYFIVLAAVFSCLVIGCGNRKAETSEYYIYYLNQDNTGLELVGYEPETEADDTEGLIEEFLALIDEGTDRVEYQKLYPEKVELDRYEYSENRLNLYFNAYYSQMDVVQEALCREAIVETMLQITGITGVSFFVDNEPLCDANGSVVGVMTLDSFVDNPGEELNDIQVADLTLYFASLDGTSLVSETQHVHYYSSNISAEKLVMEQLLKGPVSDNAQSAIPDNTGLIGVSVLDGACMVNLDENFLSQNYDIQEEVVIYSIVNSLSELSTVDTVQIAVNGENNIVYRQDLSLQEFYTADSDLVTQEVEEVDVDQEEQSEKEGLLDTGK